MNPNLPDHLNTRARQVIEGIGGNQLSSAGVRVIQGPLGSVILDFAIDRPGTLGGGISLADICMSGLAVVKLCPSSNHEWPLPQVSVWTDFPLAACIASQYAGWPLSTSDYFAMASGPARLLRGSEPILETYGLREDSTQAVVVLESSQLPTENAVHQLAADCQLEPPALTICIARTASHPGTIQIVARCIETTLHKLFELGFDLRSITSAFGTVPLPPIAKSDLKSIGWTNDAIIFGSNVVLWVNCDDEAIEAIGHQIPSQVSPDFGLPFIDIFERYGQDFYRIDKLLFSPAQVTINNLTSGRSFQFGKLHWSLLRGSVGLPSDA